MRALAPWYSKVLRGTASIAAILLLSILVSPAQTCHAADDPLDVWIPYSPARRVTSPLGATLPPEIKTGQHLKCDAQINGSVLTVDISLLQDDKQIYSCRLICEGVVFGETSTADKLPDPMMGSCLVRLGTTEVGRELLFTSGGQGPVFLRSYGKSLGSQRAGAGVGAENGAPLSPGTLASLERDSTLSVDVSPDDATVELYYKRGPEEVLFESYTGDLLDEPLPHGSYRIRVTALGYFSVEDNLQVLRARTKEYKLLPAPRTDSFYQSAGWKIFKQATKAITGAEPADFDKWYVSRPFQHQNQGTTYYLHVANYTRDRTPYSVDWEIDLSSFGEFQAVADAETDPYGSHTGCIVVRITSLGRAGGGRSELELLITHGGMGQCWYR